MQGFGERNVFVYPEICFHKGVFWWKNKGFGGFLAVSNTEVAVSPTGDTARTGARLGPARTGSDLKVPAVSPAVSPAGDTAVDA